MPPDKYTLIRELGRGGFGVVWLAEDPSLGRRVALKILEGTDTARFQREARLAASLSHPNIAAIYEAADDYIAMQFIDGAPLSALRLPPREALEAVRDAARAVHYAHERGIIHRDLKPHNLMRGDRVYVLDFGLARPMEHGSSLTVSDTILGTPAYMSPEQALAAPADARTDVYGLGATLYDLLAGRPPFAGGRPLDVLRQVIDKDPEPLRVERDVRTIVGKAMEKEPARRYATAAEFADDIDRYLRGDAIVARPASPLYRLRKRLAKRKALAAAVLVAAVALAAWWHQQRRTGEAQQQTQETVAALTRADEALMRYEQERLRPLHPMTVPRALLARAEANLVEATRLQPDAHAVWAKLGEVRLRMMKAAGARDAFAEAVRLAPDSAEYRYGLGRALNGMFETEMVGQVEFGPEFKRATRTLQAELAETMQRALDLGLADRGASDTARMIVHIHADEMDRARDIAEAVEDAGDSDMLALLNAAIVFHGAGEPERAAALADRAVDQARSDLGAYGYRGFLATLREDRVQMRRDAEAMILLAPEFHNGYALRAFAGGDAEKDLTTALSLAPELAGLRWVRSRIRLDGGDPAGAVEDLDAVIGRLPAFADAYRRRARAYRRLLRTDEALRDADRAVEIRPDDESYETRAFTRYFAGDRDGAEADCTAAVERNAKNADAWGLRGAIRAQAGRHDEAVADLTRALALTPDDVEALSNRGAALLDLDRPDEAMADLDRALTLRPDFVAALLNRARAYFNLGDDARSVADAERFLELAPADHPDREAVERWVLKLRP